MEHAPRAHAPRGRTGGNVLYLSSVATVLLLLFLAFAWNRELAGQQLLRGPASRQTSRTTFRNIAPKLVRGDGGAHMFMSSMPRRMNDMREKMSVQCAVTASSTPSSTGAVTASSDDYKVLMKVELPEFIPRPDLMEQFLRWAYIELREHGKDNFGIEGVTVEPIYLEDKWVEKYGEDPQKMKVVNGFSTQLGEAKLEVVMDDEVILGYDYIGMDENGFPEKRGNTFEVLGKYFEVRRIGNNPVSEDTTKAVKLFGKALNSAFDKYYAFGSIYADDAT